MKQKILHLFGMTAALIWLAAALCCPVQAEKSSGAIQKSDPYILKLGDESLRGSYPSYQPYLYTSPFLVSHRVTSADGTETVSGGDFPEVFNLINPTKLDGEGEGDYASIAAYSMGASAEFRENTSYRRLALETSFSGETAGKLRAVVLNGYPGRDVGELQYRANSWLREKGLPEIMELQSGEAILATQIAVWQLAGGKQYTIVEPYYGWKDLTTASWKNYLKNVVHTETVYQQPSEHSAWNVEGLFRYLYNLESVEQKYDAVSEASLEDPVYSAVKEENGTYTVTASVCVNTTVSEGDVLVLGAECGQQEKNQPVTAAGTYTFTFTGLPARMAVKMEINGCQQGGDVYLFEDESGSQKLVGYDDSVLPVHGEVTAVPDRILTIFKSTGEEAGNTPLANIQFNIYRVATMAEIEQGAAEVRESPTEEEIEKYKTAGNLVAILSTDEQGMAVFNFTASGNPDGLYLIMEQYSAATTGAVEPFYLLVGGDAYTLNVNPKNAVEAGPDIRKDVAAIGKEHASVGIGESHLWILRGSIPAGIGTAQMYVITDPFDECLTLEKGSVAVKLCTRSGEELELTENAHYTLAEEELRVSLLPAGMAYVAANLGEGEMDPEIRVYLRAAINEKAEMGTEIGSQAQLAYTNSAGIAYEACSNAAEVHTGGFHLQVTDAEGKGLRGAVFRIARLAGELDSDAEVLEFGQQELKVVYVEVFCNGEKTGVVTSSEDGRAAVYGLAYGDYYLVETAAPGGFTLPEQPVEFTVGADSHQLDAERGEAVRVINPQSLLPETGDLFLRVLIVEVLAAGAMACLLLFANRKKRRYRM